MSLNMEQLEKQLDKEDFQEIGSMAAFNVNERQMQTTEENVDTYKALDDSSVDTESSRTESKEQDTGRKSRNDAHDDVADIRPIYDEEPMAEVQTTAKIDVFAIGQQHIEQPEFNNEGEVVQNAEECHDTFGLRWVPTGKIFASSTTKVDSEPIIGSNADITNEYECEQTLDVSAGTLNLSAGTSFNSKEEGLGFRTRIHDHINEQSSSKLVPDVVPQTFVANNTLGLVPQRQKASDYDNLDPVPQRKDVYSSADANIPLQQELDLLFGPLYDEFFNAGSNPSTNNQSTSAPSTHTNVHAEENNNDQAEEE
nr:hypothetical protein [Tanacetum cinerariifolium]